MKSCKYVLNKMQQRNISKEVQEGVAELREAFDAIKHYREMWKLTETQRFEEEREKRKPDMVNKFIPDDAVVKARSESKKAKRTRTRKRKRTKPASRERKPKARSDAVVFKRAKGHSYAQILKNLRQNVKPDNAEVSIRSIRKTNTGAILSELEKGSKKD